MFNIRLKFSKLGVCSYISHLDLMRTLQRSFVRSGLPVKYTQGFNPHIYLSILAPLSTGFESLYELVDFSFDCEEYPENAIEKLNEAFPKGIEAVEIYQNGRKPGEIAYSVYEIVYEHGNAEEMAEFLKQPVIITKESKRQSKEINVNDYIREIKFEQMGEKVKCTCTLPLGNDQLNPAYVSEALSKGGFVLEDDTPRYKRIALLDKELKLFR